MNLEEKDAHIVSSIQNYVVILKHLGKIVDENPNMSAKELLEIAKVGGKKMFKYLILERYAE